MVLNDITDDAILVKVATATLCAKVLTEDDLHIADEAAVPQWLKDQVGKPQHLHTTVGSLVSIACCRTDFKQRQKRAAM